MIVSKGYIRNREACVRECNEQAHFFTGTILYRPYWTYLVAGRRFFILSLILWNNRVRNRRALGLSSGEFVSFKMMSSFLEESSVCFVPSYYELGRWGLYIEFDGGSIDWQCVLNNFSDEVFSLLSGGNAYFYCYLGVFGWFCWYFALMFHEEL